MPMRLEGSCRCGAVGLALPYPYQRRYCSICRKSAAGGGWTIAAALMVGGRRTIGVWHATIDERILRP